MPALRSIINEKYEFEDFSDNATATTSAASVPATVRFGALGWRAIIGPSGTVTYTNTGVDVNHDGVIDIATGGNSAGAAGGIRNSASNANFPIILGTGLYEEENWIVQVPTLSSVAEEFIFRCGYGDQTILDPTNGIYFQHDKTSSNWLAFTMKASSPVQASGGTNVAVSAGQWAHLKRILDTTNDKAYFYVNGTFIGSANTLPTAGMAQFFNNLKKNGTTTRSVYIDAYDRYKKWTIPRAA